MDDKPLIYFSSYTPIPQVWNQTWYLKDLKNALNPECLHYYFIKGIYQNLYTVIHTYETGKMPSHDTVYFKRREIVLEVEANIRDTFV